MASQWNGRLSESITYLLLGMITFFQNSEAALISRYEPYMSSMKSIVKTVIENLADGTVGYSNPYVTDDPKIYIGM